MFAFLQDDHKELENLNDSFENNNGLSVGPNVSETFADFSYSEAAKRLRLALQTDEINEEEPENIIIEQEVWVFKLSILQMMTFFLTKFMGREQGQYFFKV